MLKINNYKSKVISRRQDSTCNLMVPNQALYQLSYPRHDDTMGLEPTVDRLKAVALSIMLRVVKMGGLDSNLKHWVMTHYVANYTNPPFLI